jgi:hypothetical protein
MFHSAHKGVRSRQEDCFVSPALPLLGDTGGTLLLPPSKPPPHPLPYHAAARAGRRKHVRRRGIFNPFFPLTWTARSSWGPALGTAMATAHHGWQRPDLAFPWPELGGPRSHREARAHKQDAAALAAEEGGWPSGRRQ